MDYVVFLILAPISILVLTIVFLSTQRYRGAPEITALRWLVACVIGWLFFNSLEVYATSPSMTLFWARVTYFFIGATPVSWLVFAVQYSSSGTRAWLRATGFWLFILIPAITVLLAWTNELHHLVWTNVAYVPVEQFLAMRVVHGPIFWAYTIHSYTMVLFGALFIVRYHLASLRVYHFQSQWLLIGALIPVAVNFIYVFEMIPGLRKDYTPIGFAAAGIAFSVGMLWHRLFDLRPIARATLVDGLVDPIMTMDQEGRLIDFNPEARRLLSDLNHVTDADCWLGLPLVEGLQPWPELVEYLESGPKESVDLMFEQAGRRVVYECRSLPLFSARDREIGCLIILHDITERKEAESALRYHMTELESSNEQLDAFAHTVAHDLKGPLTTIIGYVEMLSYYLDQLESAEVRQNLAELELAGERMVGIVDALLLLSRVYRAQDLLIDRVEMGDLVAESLDRVASSIMKTQAQISAPALWPPVMGYGPWIVEVWVNYLTNAIKYGGEPPIIELGYDTDVVHSDAQGSARFWVRDHGIGLSESQIQKLFMPYTRFNMSFASGQGLGLSIVRRIIDRLGGSVGVESKLGKGSTFWFSLPLPADYQEPMDVGPRQLIT